MTNEQIESFLLKNNFETVNIKVSFKTRQPHICKFLKSNDFQELKSKNFWRLVGESNFEKYNRSKDESLARIFSGAEFTKLSLAD